MKSTMGLQDNRRQIVEQVLHREFCEASKKSGSMGQIGRNGGRLVGRPSSRAEAQGEAQSAGNRLGARTTVTTN